MKSEIKSMVENKTFTIVDLPENRKTVGGTWVYSLKTNTNRSRDTLPKDSPSNMELIILIHFHLQQKCHLLELIMQIAAEKELNVHQLDVIKSAYRNAPIDCELYVE